MTISPPQDNRAGFSSIISEISEVYGVWIPSDEIIPDNFNSAEAMYELVQDLKEE